MHVVVVMMQLKVYTYQLIRFHGWVLTDYQPFVEVENQTVDSNRRCSRYISLINLGHGLSLHDMGPEHDRYIDCDDPAGRSPKDLKDLVRKMCNKYIDLHIFHLNDVTNKQEKLLENELKKVFWALM